MKTKFGRLLFLTIMVAAVMLCISPSDGVCEEPSWRVEFDETCASTSEAMAFSQTELQALIARCERLQKAIEQLDESTRKVFLKRLLMCKNLYQYVLDSKKAEPEQTTR